MNLQSAIEGHLLFKSSRCSPATIRTDECQLHQFLDWYGDRPVETVTSEDIRSYLQHHKDRGLSPHTIRRHLAILSTLFRWLTDPEVDIVEHNPASAIQPPKLPDVKPKAIDKDDIQALMNAADTATAKRVIGQGL